MIALSVRVCTVSSQWLDIFIQFSVSYLYISSGAAQNQIWDGCGCSGQRHQFFSWCYSSYDLFIFDRNHFCKNGMVAILNFKFTQKRIIKNILAFRSRRITIFMSKFTFSRSVTANVRLKMPLKMTPNGFNHTKQESPAVARKDTLQPIQLLLQY